MYNVFDIIKMHYEIKCNKYQDKIQKLDLSSSEIEKLYLILWEEACKETLQEIFYELKFDIEFYKNLYNQLYLY